MLKPKDLLEHLEKVAYSDEMLEPKNELTLDQMREHVITHYNIANIRTLSQQTMLAQQNQQSLNDYQYASSVTLPQIGLTYGGNQWKRP